MSIPQVELDFFSMEKHSSVSLSPQQQRRRHHHRHRDRRPSFRGIQNVVSKIKPEVLKSVIASGSARSSTPKSFESGSSPTYSLPVLRFTCEKPSAPMTIFYNGNVFVFDLPPHKAEGIMKFAMEGRIPFGEAEVRDNDTAAASSQEKGLLGVLAEGDLPIVRKKSLQRFFEKRKERLISVSPY